MNINPSLKNIILIAGATASGKSKIALDLAKKYNSVIINADSLQIYADLSILTARPDENDLKQTPHRLYGLLNHTQNWSVVDWCKNALIEIENAHKNNQIPILVGGTGLYFTALLKGIADIPDIDLSIREQIRTDLQKKGSLFLHHQLQLHDPIMAAKLHENDTQRIARALEVILSTKISLNEWQQQTKPLLDKNEYEIHLNIINLERDILYHNINHRFDKMIELGVLNEVKYFINLNVNSHSTLYKALGLRELIAYLKGETTLEAAIEKAKQNSRHYAKRQLTWFRHQLN